MRTKTAVATPDVNVSLPSTQSADSPKPSAEQAILNRFVAMAQAYRVEGSMFSAMELFWRLVEDYPGTTQAEESKNTLLEIAMQYERDGLRHPAYAIYERLL